MKRASSRFSTSAPFDWPKWVTRPVRIQGVGTQILRSHISRGILGRSRGRTGAIYILTLLSPLSLSHGAAPDAGFTQRCSEAGPTWHRHWTNIRSLPGASVPVPSCTKARDMGGVPRLFSQRTLAVCTSFKVTVSARI